MPQPISPSKVTAVRHLPLVLTLVQHGIKVTLASPALNLTAVSLTPIDNEGSRSYPNSPRFWHHLFISIMLVMAGGVCAGLTLGLMGLDDLHLRVLAASSSNPQEKRNAQTVLNLLQKRRHWVLVVLLLSNVIVNESLPIFLDTALGGGVAAIGLSTIAIVLFGIIPQAVSVHYGLSIGATCAPLVFVLMYMMAPIAYPIACVLDYALGIQEPHTAYNKAELKSLLQLHRGAGVPEPLRDDEVNILSGVLELEAKKIESIMTPLKDVMALSSDAIIDKAMLQAMIQSGYSRFPVHLPCRPQALIGILLVKRLLGYDPRQALPVSSFELSVLPEAHTSVNCFQALDYFQTGRAHMLLISRTPGQEGGALGVVTLEDIIEEIITEEIVDETDRYSDNHRMERVSRVTPSFTITSIVERGMQQGLSDYSGLFPKESISHKFINTSHGL